VGDRVVSSAVEPSVGALFDAQYERLVAHLSVVAGSREVAADAVQAAFVEAHLQWDRISGYDDPAGWVRRVALNRIRNHHRGRSRARRALVRLAGRDAPVDGMAAAVDRMDVAEALTRLSVQQRTAVVLHHLEGLPVPEVAREMRVTAGTVKTHLHRARAALRPMLEDDDA
jgi:RNA polymerase sigma-70 factor (ECF subfamily)